MRMRDDEEMHRQALDKVLGEIADAMDDQDARRLRGEIDAGDNPRAENPVEVDNLAVDGAQSEAELEGGHAGNLAAEDVNDAEGGDLTAVAPGEDEASAVAEEEGELDRAAAEPGANTRPVPMGGLRRRRFRR